MNNRKILYGVIGGILIISLLAVIGVGKIVSARGATNANINMEGNNAGVKENTLVVTGLGKVSIKPDVAYLTVGVQTMDKDAKKAQNDNKDVMNKVMNRLKSLKIEEKDIQTSAYNILPRYNYDGNKETLEGYEVENMIRITVRNVETVGDVLDAVSKEGANRSNGISFGVIDTDAIYKEALEKAIDDAKGKADTMSKKAGMTVEKPLSIYEGNESNQVFRDELMRNNSALKMDMGEVAGAGVPITAGELEIEANVTIVYKMK